MKPECWVSICYKCVTETHKGHKIIDLIYLSQEARNTKDKLVKTKRSDLASINHLIEGIKSLNVKLNEMHKKRQIDLKTLEENLIEQLRKIAEKEELQYNELTNEVIEVQKKLKESYNSQEKEIDKLPELAEAVISKGTLDDLKTFFEMCQNGLEANSEIFQYKESTDKVKKEVESYMFANPFACLSNFNSLISKDSKLLRKRSISSFLVEEKQLEELMNNSLSSIEIITPSTINNDSFMFPKEIKRSETRGRVNLSLGLYPKNISRIKEQGKSFTGNYNFRSTRPSQAQRSLSKAIIQKTPIKKLNTKPSRRSISAMNTFRVSTEKKQQKIKKDIEELKDKLKSISAIVSVHSKLFSNVVPAIRNAIKFLNKTKDGKRECISVIKKFVKSHSACLTQRYAREQETLGILPLSYLDSLLNRFQVLSVNMKKFITLPQSFKGQLSPVKGSSINSLPLVESNKNQVLNKNLMEEKVLLVSRIQETNIKELERKYNQLYEKYKTTCNKVKDMSSKVSALKTELELIKGELIGSLMKVMLKNCNKKFKKLFIKCYSIIKTIKKDSTKLHNDIKKRKDINKLQALANIKNMQLKTDAGKHGLVTNENNP